MFKLHAKYQPTGDQPQAIAQLTNGISNLRKHQTLLGVTGSGKTFTMANLIANTQKATLVLAHNKTLAAQLYSEFREFFPENPVHYFVSYFDYYQPEAYIAASDTYIEKDSAINEEIDRLRHAATASLLTRDDVIVVASVSCIYGIGSPSHYISMSLVLFSEGDMWYARGGDAWLRERAESGFDVDKKSDDNNSDSIKKSNSGVRKITQQELLMSLINMQYHRNDVNFERGNFRVRGEVVDLFTAAGDAAYRFTFAFDELESVAAIDPLTGVVQEKLTRCHIFPNTHYATPKEEILRVVGEIRAEFKLRHQELLNQQKYLEAERLAQRIKYDIEMLEETGFVKGIENYSRFLDGRKVGQPPYTLLDFFPKDYLMIVDESHMTLPQVRGMFNGDHARKENLVEYGFRLPSAIDNRPLTFDEFTKRINQVVYVSATPGEYELMKSGEPVRQVIRPTGLLDPEIEVRPIDGQIDDLMSEIHARVKKQQRVLITTLTKRMAEDLTDYLVENNIKTAYLHSDIDTLERSDILRDLRAGTYDVLVGINLLREGLDLPEVSLVLILDADKEGFLRSESALIQTIGRAARHTEGKVIMYADRITESMNRAISETNKRREIQMDYNTRNGITPKSVAKEIGNGLRDIIPQKEDKKNKTIDLSKVPKEDYLELKRDLKIQMEDAAANLEFERAASLRDAIAEIDKKIAKK